MDMPLPNAIRALSDDSRERLVKLAEALGCSPDIFFEPEPGTSLADTAKLIQMWSAITSLEGRQVVFRCIREVLKEQAEPKRRSQAKY